MRHVFPSASGALRPRWRGLLAAALALAAPFSMFAQKASEPPAEALPRVPRVRELWTPASELDAVLARYPRAVSLSREQFETLLRDARPKLDPAKSAPPADAALRQARLEGWLVDKGAGMPAQVRVVAELAVEVLSDHWAEVPIGLTGVALETAELDRAEESSATSGVAPPVASLGNAALLRQGEGNESPVALLIRGRGPHRLRLSFLLSVSAAQGSNRILLPRVRGAAAELILHLPGGALVHSSLPCSTQPEGQAATGTLARVALPLSEDAEDQWLAWKTESPAASENGLFNQETTLEYSVEETAAAARMSVNLKSPLGRLPGELRLPLPPQARAARLEGGAVRRWELIDGAMRVEPAADGAGLRELSFTLEFQLPLNLDPQSGASRVALPVPEFLGAHDVTGKLILRRGRGMQIYRMEPSAGLTPKAGLLPPEEEAKPDFAAGFAVADLPQTGAAAAAPPPTLTVDARRVASRFSVDADVLADFQPTGVSIERTLTFHVEQGEIFSARIVLPPGEDLLAVSDSPSGREPDWRREGGEAVIVWNAGLSADAAAPTAIKLKSRAELPAPPADNAPAAFELGALAVRGAERLTGYIALKAAAGYRLVAQAEDKLERRDGRMTPVRGDVAWFYRGDYRLALRVERATAQTEAGFVGYALPLAGAVEIHAQINYRFLFSGVKTVRVRVPRETANAFYFTGQGIAERNLDGDVWTIRFQSERTGEYALGVRATLPCPAQSDDPARFRFRLPAITPLDAARWSGTWAVEANADTEIRFAVAQANEADALRAPELAGYQPQRRVIGVFDFIGGQNPAIDLEGVRRPAAKAASAVVDELRLETFVSTSGAVRHHATLLARTAGDQFFNIRLPKKAALWTLTLDDELIKPIGGRNGELRVELPGGREPNSPSRVEIVCETPGKAWKKGGWQRLQAPRFDADVPVIKSSWRLWLPDGFVYRGFDSALASEKEPEPGLLLHGLVRSTGYFLEHPLYAIDRWSARSHAISTMMGQAGVEPEPVQELIAPLDSPARPATAPANGRAKDKAAEVTRWLTSTIIPRIEFRETPIREAIQYIRDETRRQGGHSFSMFLKLPSTPNLQGAGEKIPRLDEPVATSAPTSAEARITLSLSNIPVLEALRYVAQQGGLKVIVETYAVSIVPLTELTDALITAEFRVPSTFIGTDSTQGASANRADAAKTFLEANGVTFPPGASVSYSPATQMLTIRNTQENIDLTETLVNQSETIRPEPTAKAVGLLPIRVDLPLNGRLFEFTGDGAPDELSFRYLDQRASARWGWAEMTLGALLYLLTAAVSGRPWRSLFGGMLALTFFPLIVAPSTVGACNALLVGWLLAFLGWSLSRRLLRRRFVLRSPVAATAALALFAPLLWATGAHAADAPAPSPMPAPEVVIVPYDAAKPLDGQRTDRLYLPYERFLDLWDAAKRNRQPPAPEALPNGARWTLSAARYDGKIIGDALQIEGVLDLQTFGEGWVGVPLNFAGAPLAGLTLDGVAVSLSEKKELWVGSPGAHRVTASMRLAAPRLGVGTRLAWSIPRAVAAAFTLTYPQRELRAALSSAGGAVEEDTPEGKRLSVALGAADRVSVEFSRAAPSAAQNAAAQPPLATISSQLTVEARRETARAEVAFSFAGGSQDHFTAYVDRGLTLIDLDAPDVKTWRLIPGADRQTLEVVLNSPARDAYRFALTADRSLETLPAASRRYPYFSALASRVEQSTALLSDKALELSLPSGLPTGVRQVPRAGESTGADRKFFAAYALTGALTPQTGIAYAVRSAAARREARINYLYQIGRGKIEMVAAVRLADLAENHPILGAELRLPGDFVVQAVEGRDVREWHRDGDVLALRFHVPAVGKDAAPSSRSVLVYLVRQFERPPESFALRPIIAQDFPETQGVAVVAADRTIKISLTLPPGVRSRDLAEVEAQTAATEFQTSLPLERQRAFRYRGAQFDVTATLAAQPARGNASWVTHATAMDGAVGWQTRVNLEVSQGAMETLSFSLPATLPEAHVEGLEVRETVSSVDADSGRRLYRVAFQKPVYGEASFTVALDLPLSADGKAALPDLLFPSENTRAAGGFILMENASSGEMSINPRALDPSTPAEAPFLPAQYAAGTHFFRAAPGVDWALEIRLANLEKTAGRAALVAYAELTSALRPNGEEWHRAVYRLQNRRLQFLPVELPAGAEFIGARAAGESVRVDSGQVDGRAVLLVPLLRTRPGETSYDVELTYRISSKKRLGGIARRQLDDPHLPGIPVEKTLWDVWLPSDYRLLRGDGNVEAALAALNETEKLESALADLQSLSATVASRTASAEERSLAYSNFNRLNSYVSGEAAKNRAAIPSVQDGNEVAQLKPKEAQGQNALVERKRAQILDEAANANRFVQQQNALPSNAKAAPRQLSQGFGGFGGFGGGNGGGGGGASNADGNAPSAYAWRDNRGQNNVSVIGGNRDIAGSTNDSKPHDAPKAGQLALNDDVSVAVPDMDKEMAAARKDEKSSQAGQKRLSTARALTAAEAPAAAADALLAKNMEQPQTPAPAQMPMPAMPEEAAAAMYDQAPAAPIVSADKAKSDAPDKAQTLRSTGRLSLAVDFPFEGQVYHYKKIKSDAVLTLWIARPGDAARIGWLGVLAALLVGWWMLGRLLNRWRARRAKRKAQWATPRAPVQT